MTEQREVQAVLKHLNQYAPLRAAESWDPVGLLLGDVCQKTRGAVVSVDLSFEAVELALQKDYSLILTHHPCLFPSEKVQGILSGTPVYEAVRHGIAVASYHTNFDRCALEVPRKIAQSFGFKLQGRFFDSKNSFVKLVTFVPQSHLVQVRSALGEAGGGTLGNYEQCSFYAMGEGSFRPKVGAKPFLGQNNEFQTVQECRLEILVPQGLEEHMVQVLLKVHPYEEVAYEFYSVRGTDGVSWGAGYGGWGNFVIEKSWQELKEHIKAFFDVKQMRVTGNIPSQIQSMGFIAGKATSFISIASQLECDLLLTGEVGYHAAVQAAQKGLVIVELGHSESEKFFVETLGQWLSSFPLAWVEVKKLIQEIH